MADCEPFNLGVTVRRRPMISKEKPGVPGHFSASVTCMRCVSKQNSRVYDVSYRFAQKGRVVGLYALFP